MSSPRGIVYLIHFDRPYHHARHYVGFTSDPDRRFNEHENGNMSSPLLKTATAAGIKWEVVRTWSDKTREFERSIKTMKNTPKYCPECSGRLRRKL